MIFFNQNYSGDPDCNALNEGYGNHPGTNKQGLVSLNYILKRSVSGISEFHHQ
jgi:hypothetical protein